MLTRMVLLRHTLPDGTSHFDWMLEPRGAADSNPRRAAPETDPDTRVLLTYRVTERIDEQGCVAFAAELLDPHRVLYLTYEGPVSKNRGKVERVTTGEVSEIRQGNGDVVIVGRFAGAAERRWLGKAVEGVVWRFEVGGGEQGHSEQGHRAT